MKFFFLAINHTEKNSLWEQLTNYCSSEARVLLAWEVAKNSHTLTNGEHFHIAADMTDKEYQAFKKTIILKKYNLCGRAKEGVGRQYGLIPEDKIRNETKFLTYTIKSNNYQSKNMDIDELQELYKNSFQKDDERDLDNQVMDYIENKYAHMEYITYNHHIDSEKIELVIVEFYIQNGKHICKSRLKTLLVKYCMTRLGCRQNFINDILAIIKYN